MALRINGVDGTYLVPNILSTKYRYRSFEPELRIAVTEGGTPKEMAINVGSKIRGAWQGVVQRSGKKACNDYFKSLSRGKTLKQVLDEGDITLHLLEPKGSNTFDDLPDANAAGRDIGIHPQFLIGNDPTELTCVLIHELAHVAGATTNPRAADAIAAEKSLNYCQCSSYFRETSKG